MGINLEGPFISREKAAAQNLKNIIPFDLKLFNTWQKNSHDLIKILTVSPECISTAAIKNILKNKQTIVSLGHSNATYEETIKAIQAGATHATHLFNGMRAINHREPGIALAALLSDKVSIELIADGVHIHPEIFKLIVKLKPLDQIILITDAMRAKGMPNGQYELGGQKVNVRNGQARLKNGTLAGSILKMNAALKNLIDFIDITLQDAIKIVSANPAKKLNIFDKKGSLTAKKDADIVVLNENLQVMLSICKGNISFQK